MSLVTLQHGVQGIETEQLVTVTCDVVGKKLGEHTVTVAWPCGENRTFTLDGLSLAVHALDAMEGHPKVWTRIVDENSRQAFVRVEHGIVHVSESRAEDASNVRVPWKDLRKAIRRAVRATSLTESDTDEVTTDG